MAAQYQDSRKGATSKQPTVDETTTSCFEASSNFDEFPIPETNPNFCKIVTIFHSVAQMAREEPEAARLIAGHPQFSVFLVGGVANGTKNDVPRKDIELFFGGESYKLPEVRSLFTRLRNGFQGMTSEIDILAGKLRQGGPIHDITSWMKGVLLTGVFPYDPADFPESFDRQVWLEDFLKRFA